MRSSPKVSEIEEGISEIVLPALGVEASNSAWAPTQAGVIHIKSIESIDWVKGNLRIFTGTNYSSC